MTRRRYSSLYSRTRPVEKTLFAWQQELCDAQAGIQRTEARLVQHKSHTEMFPRLSEHCDVENITDVFTSCQTVYERGNSLITNHSPERRELSERYFEAFVSRVFEVRNSFGIWSRIPDSCQILTEVFAAYTKNTKSWHGARTPLSASCAPLLMPDGLSEPFDISPLITSSEQEISFPQKIVMPLSVVGTAFMNEWQGHYRELARKHAKPIIWLKNSPHLCPLLRIVFKASRHPDLQEYFKLYPREKLSRAEQEQYKKPIDINSLASEFEANATRWEEDTDEEARQFALHYEDLRHESREQLRVLRKLVLSDMVPGYVFIRLQESRGKESGIRKIMGGVYCVDKAVDTGEDFSEIHLPQPTLFGRWPYPTKVRYEAAERTLKRYLRRYVKDAAQLKKKIAILTEQAKAEDLQRELENVKKKRRASELERAAAAAHYGDIRKIAPEIRKEIERNVTPESLCPYCDESLGGDWQADHIYPVKRGGLSTLDNMVAVCLTCNNAKSDKTLSTFIRDAGLDRGVVEERLAALGKTF